MQFTFNRATVSSCQHSADWSESMRTLVGSLFFPILFLISFGGRCDTQRTIIAPLFWWFFSLELFDQISVWLQFQCARVQTSNRNKNKAIYLIVKCARVKINVFNEFHNHSHKSRIAKQSVPPATISRRETKNEEKKWKAIVSET